VPRDAARARELFERACRGRDASGCLDLALDTAAVAPTGPLPCATNAACAPMLKSNHEICEYGNDAACLTALDLYRFLLKACDTGRACTEIGAVLQSACDAGHGPACVRLADIYSRGRGIAGARAKVLDLRRRACEAGEIDACADAGGARQ
jgi:TPR repeat protein